MDDWRVGDLALCVKREPWRNGSTMRNGGPQSGQTFAVEAVYLAADDGTLMLGFPEYPFEGFAARHFRKIRPLTDEERDSFLADLDEPITPARRVAPVDAALNARVGHLYPLACPASILPDPSAANPPCRADGSGLSDHVAAHEGSPTSQVQQ